MQARKIAEIDNDNTSSLSDNTFQLLIQKPKAAVKI